MKINQTFPTHAAMVEAVDKYLADGFDKVRIKDSQAHTDKEIQVKYIEYQCVHWNTTQ